MEYFNSGSISLCPSEVSQRLPATCSDRVCSLCTACASTVYWLSIEAWNQQRNRVWACGRAGQWQGSACTMTCDCHTVPLSTVQSSDVCAWLCTCHQLLHGLLEHSTLPWRHSTPGS